MSDTLNPAQTSTLRESCVLVEYHGGFYQWNRRDIKASRDLSNQTTNRNDSFTAFKNLFVGCDAILASIKSVINEARAFHYNATLPTPKNWRGSQLISNALVPSYRERMTEFAMKLDSLKNALSTEWATLLKTAPANLGSAYNPNDYPSLQYVLSACYIEVTFGPIPDAGDIPDNPTLGFIREQIRTERNEAYDLALTNVWERLLEAVTAARQNLLKLSSKDGRFRTEWHDNLAEMLPILRKLNVSEDPRFDEMADRCSQLLRFSPDELKQSLTKREEVSKDADKIFNDLSAFFARPAVSQ